MNLEETMRVQHVRFIEMTRNPVIYKEQPPNRELKKEKGSSM